MEGRRAGDSFARGAGHLFVGLTQSRSDDAVADEISARCSKVVKFGFSSRPYIIMFSKQNTIAKVAPELWPAIQSENRRQEDHIELIASENYVSYAVLEAQGSQLTNKYAEGYPGKRYYGGCEHVDVAEQLAIDRAKKLFGAEAANVQPNSGSQANQAVFMAFLKP